MLTWHLPLLDAVHPAIRNKKIPNRSYCVYSGAVCDKCRKILTSKKKKKKGIECMETEREQHCSHLLPHIFVVFYLSNT